MTPKLKNRIAQEKDSQLLNSLLCSCCSSNIRRPALPLCWPLTFAAGQGAACKCWEHAPPCRAAVGGRGVLVRERGAGGSPAARRLGVGNAALPECHTNAQIIVSWGRPCFVSVGINVLMKLCDFYTQFSAGDNSQL